MTVEEPSHTQDQGQGVFVILHLLLSPTFPMKFQVTEIEFDFEMEENQFPSQDYQKSLINETIQKVWEVDNEEELSDLISDHFGWCIKSLDYHEFPHFSYDKEFS